MSTHVVYINIKCFDKFGKLGRLILARNPKRCYTLGWKYLQLVLISPLRKRGAVPT